MVLAGIQSTCATDTMSLSADSCPFELALPYAVTREDNPARHDVLHDVFCRYT